MVERGRQGILARSHRVSPTRPNQEAHMATNPLRGRPRAIAGGERTTRRAAVTAIVGSLALGCGDTGGETLERQEEPAGVSRKYFIAADEVLWNYAPLGFNAVTGEPFDEQA